MFPSTDSSVAVNELSVYKVVGKKYLNFVFSFLKHMQLDINRNIFIIVVVVN